MQQKTYAGMGDEKIRQTHSILVNGIKEYFKKNKFEKAFAHDLLYMFDKIRKKRHTVVYEQVNLISEKEAEYALQVASDFVEKVNNILEGKMEK